MSLSWMNRKNLGVYYLLDRGVHTGVRVVRHRTTPRMRKYMLLLNRAEIGQWDTLAKAKGEAVSLYQASKEQT